MFDHTSIEKQVSEFWKTNSTKKKVTERNKGSKKTFYFCDGPPYATGQIHPGTAWNKTLKDAVCRYYRMRGYYVRAQAGFDTHGLPIEVKVEQEMGIKNKQEIESRGVPLFIQSCKKFATKYIGIMSGQFDSLGVWFDFDNPYITYKDSYIDKSWSTIQKAHEKGLLHEGVYVLPYCYRCETTIANYELEYADETDPSVYVKFKVKGKENEYLVIWTTTPWTLAANMAVMAHPTYQYVRAQVGSETWIVAESRLEHVTSMVNESAIVQEVFAGSALKGLQYEHPFESSLTKKFSRHVVLSSDYVTLDDGTGLVHCAPGHGPEDFIVGKQNSLEPFCPVDERGCYTEEVVPWKGKNVKSMNPIIIGFLNDLGVLVKELRVRHRYPHCWRCKTPLIFITTKQWFITISKMKEEMLKEVESTTWQPQFAKDRFREFVANAPDWCISRQRYWGIPLPIWKCEKKTCGKVKVLGSAKELPKMPEELHKPYIDEIHFTCSCGSQMSRVSDVLDVWFDSGNAIWASLSDEEVKTFTDRADLILEGVDQIRGWFYSLLGSGVVRYGKCPYKKILMHGFFVDEKGEKMSKSVGNFIPIEEILAKYGADAFRLFGTSNTTWDELKFNWTELKKASSDLTILLNMVSFLERFYPATHVAQPKHLRSEDKWMLSKMHAVQQVFEQSMENLEFHVAVKAVRELLVEDLSRFYMKVAKDRISQDDDKEAALYVIYETTRRILSLLAIVCPFTAEHAYQRFFRKFESHESLFLAPYLEHDARLINSTMNVQMDIVRHVVSQGLLLRQQAKIKLRYPVRTLHVTKDKTVSDALTNYKEVVLTLMNAKGLSFDAPPTQEGYTSLATDQGILSVKNTLDEELFEEGVATEVRRRIQMQRKDLGLVESDHISVVLDTEAELAAIIKKQLEFISSKTNAKTIEFGVHPDAKEFEVDGRLLKVFVRKI